MPKTTKNFHERPILIKEGVWSYGDEEQEETQCLHEIMMSKDTPLKEEKNED